jgi:hypothetical protein
MKESTVPFNVGDVVRFKPTTDEFVVEILRELNPDEVDPEVGPMYVVGVHAYDDELTLVYGGE